jgi:hypothetical protein
MSSSPRFVLRRHLPLLLLPLAFLDSCARPSSLEAATATGDEVVFTYTADRAAEAERQASLYCANLGRNARLRERHETSDRIVATYECRR